VNNRGLLPCVLVLAVSLLCSACSPHVKNLASGPDSVYSNKSAQDVQITKEVLLTGPAAR
jgi:hypothetical protein